jgi:hypothetical protein
MRDRILAINDRPTAPVVIPEWDNMTVYVRVFSGAERLAVTTLLLSEKPSVAAIVALVACDEKGERIFSDDDVAALEDKNAQALERIALAAWKLNGMTAEAQGDVKND